MGLKGYIRLRNNSGNYITNNNITCTMVLNFELNKKFQISFYIIESTINFNKNKYLIVDGKTITENYQKTKIIEKELSNENDKIQIEAVNFQRYDELLIFYQS
jgi:hypothetical protein